MGYGNCGKIFSKYVIAHDKLGSHFIEYSIMSTYIDFDLFAEVVGSKAKVAFQI